MHTDKRFATAVEEAVSRIEQTTDAEIVVVAAPRSGMYRDLQLLAGVSIAGAFLILAVFSPITFYSAWIPADLLLLLFGTAWFVGRWPWLLRLLSSKRRMVAQVDHGAAAAFHEDQVHATRARTGILIYLSAMEERIVLIPDHGIHGRVPQAEWNAIDWDVKTLDGFLRNLQQVGDILARHIPALDTNPDELPNAPRIRS